MTQHTDMGGLVERLNQAADDLVSGATIFSVACMAKHLTEAADAIEALSIPQGLGEDEVDRAAKGLFEDWVAEDFNEEYCSWEQLPDKVTWRRRARAALTSARAQ
jgi:hypothetical protein